MNTDLIKKALVHALKKAEEQSSSFANQNETGNNIAKTIGTISNLTNDALNYPRPLDLKPPINTQLPNPSAATANKGFLSRLGSKVKSIIPKSVSGPVSKVAPYVRHYGGQALGAIGTGMDAYDAYKGFRDGNNSKIPKAYADSIAALGGVISLAGAPQFGIPTYAMAKAMPYMNNDPEFWKDYSLGYHY